MPAEQIIDGELARVHPALSGASLATVKRFSQNRSVMGAAADEKTNALTRAKSLAQRFQDSLLATGSTVIVLMAFALISGCGLKTHPFSDVVEFRPDIPFRATAPDPINSPPSGTTDPVIDARAPTGETPSNGTPGAATDGRRFQRESTNGKQPP